MTRLRLAPIILALALAATSVSAEERPYTPMDIHQLKSVSDPRLSPDGTLVTYVVTTTDITGNRKNADLWLIPAAGGDARQLTHHQASDTAPRWSPDGQTLAFLSSRHGGKPQVHLLPLDGGEAKRITNVQGGVGHPWWAPDGGSLLFTAKVYPGTDLDGTAERDDFSDFHKFLFGKE